MTKAKVAFICVHNSCRSQMAEAEAKILGSETMEVYSAGTEKVPRINQTAVKLIQEKYHIDINKSQYSKTISEIPDVDIVITMGCNVLCPSLPAKHREDWGLDDPSGKAYEAYIDVLSKIENNIKNLIERINNNQIAL